MRSGADLGLAVHLHRLLAEMKQTALASAAEVSDKTISAWKSGSRKPNQNLLVKVAGALHMPLTDLEDTADIIAWYRAKRRRAIASEEAARFPLAGPLSRGSLSLDELHREIGLAYAVLDELTAELRSRRERS
jgi:transcriptional regulator with XRE-family HTH domain